VSYKFTGVPLVKIISWVHLVGRSSGGVEVGIDRWDENDNDSCYYECGEGGNSIHAGFTQEKEKREEMMAVILVLQLTLIIGHSIYQV